MQASDVTVDSMIRVKCLWTSRAVWLQSKALSAQPYFCEPLR